MLKERENIHKINLAFYHLEGIREILESGCKLSLSEEVESKIEAGARFVKQRAEEGKHIYGVNTGFGSLCETRVEASEMEELQYNHIVSHACGVGPIVPENISRLVMFIKILTFRTGNTGISVPTVNRMIDFWNHGVIPVIPKKGTVGASGDLAPLAHMALPLLGLGKVHFQGSICDSRAVLEKLGWEPINLKPKEGLALTNGVQYINAIAALCLMQIDDLIKSADVIAAMSIQAFSASRTFYHPLYHETSWHEERRTVAANLSRLLAGSNHSELETCNQSKQDPYSFRCLPQVHAAIRQTYGFAKKIIEQECNSVSDNPLFFAEQNEILYGGNLHGESTAFALDFLSIAISELANISERRTYQLLSGQRGLPSFLVKRPGLNSGLMIAQYTSAALVNENKVLSTPASIDTIPTCQLQEDHVSMGGTSAYKLSQIIENCEYIQAIELLTAAQAIDFNQGLRLSPITQEIMSEFREKISFMQRDRIVSDDIEQALSFFRERKRQWSTRLNLD